MRAEGLPVFLALPFCSQDFNGNTDDTDKIDFRGFFLFLMELQLQVT